MFLREPFGECPSGTLFLFLLFINRDESEGYKNLFMVLHSPILNRIAGPDFDYAHQSQFKNEFEDSVESVDKNSKYLGITQRTIFVDKNRELSLCKIP